MSAEELKKPDYASHTIFIDVLVVPQQQVTSPEVVKATNENYQCWVVVFVAGNYLSRGWCLLEICVACIWGSKLTVIGSFTEVIWSDFFSKMETTKKDDEQLIKAEILRLYETSDRFNGIVFLAMQVCAQKIARKP